VLSKLRVRAERDGTFEVPLSSPPEPVDVLVKASMVVPTEGRTRIGRWSISLVPGGQVEVPFRLSGRLTRLLARRGRLGIHIGIRTEGETGTSFVRSRLVVRGATRAGSVAGD
jgi:hypothetical protein